MRAKSVVEFIHDKTVSQTAQYNYRKASAEINELADLMAAVGDRKKAGEFRLFAFIARHAARAEYFDPEPR